MFRKCAYCGLHKDITDFKRSGKNACPYTNYGGRQAWCKACAGLERRQRLTKVYREMCRRSIVTFPISSFFFWIDCSNYDDISLSHKASGNYSDSPSMDAILPRIKGGIYKLENMRVLTVSENSKARKQQGATPKGKPAHNKGKPSPLRGKPRTGKATAKGVTIVNSLTGESITYRTQRDAAQSISCRQRDISKSKTTGKPISGFPHLQASR